MKLEHGSHRISWRIFVKNHVGFFIVNSVLCRNMAAIEFHQSYVRNHVVFFNFNSVLCANIAAIEFQGEYLFEPRCVSHRLRVVFTTKSWSKRLWQMTSDLWVVEPIWLFALPKSKHVDVEKRRGTMSSNFLLSFLRSHALTEPCRVIDIEKV